MGEKPDQQQVLREVGLKAKEKTADRLEKPSDLQKEQITAADLQAFFNRSFNTTDVPVEKDRQDMQTAFNQAITDIATAHKDNGITEQQIRAWIFGESLKSTGGELGNLQLGDTEVLDNSSTTSTEAPQKITALNLTLFKLGFLKELKTPATYTTETESAVKALKTYLNTALDLKDATKLENTNGSFDKKTLDQLTAFITKETTPAETTGSAQNPAPAEPVPPPKPATTDSQSAENPAPAMEASEHTSNFIEADNLTTAVTAINPGAGLKGKKGEQVTALQKVLYSISKIHTDIPCQAGDKGQKKDGVDGNYGPLTKTAVETLQKAIHKFLQSQKSAIEKSDPNFFTQNWLDKSESDFADGNFGPRTRTALLKFLELKKTEPAPEPAPVEPAAQASPETGQQAPAQGAAETPDLHESSETVDTDRIRRNLDSLLAGEKGNEYLAKEQSFIYKDHREILTWVAASKYGDNAKEVRLQYSHSGDTARFTVRIVYNDGKEAFAPPTHNLKDSRIVTNHTEIGALIGIKRALVQGVKLKDSGDIIKMQSELPTRSQVDATLQSKLDNNPQNIPNTLETSEMNAPEAAVIMLQRIAQESLGIKITPSTNTENLTKVATYLVTLNNSTKELDAQMAAFDRIDPSSTSKLPPGLPILPSDKEAILAAFLKDNEALLKAIEIKQLQLSTSLKALQEKGEDNGLPEGTKINPAAKIITLPATYKITSEGHIMYKKTIDFNDSTKSVATDIKVEEKDGKTIITVTGIEAAGLASGSDTTIPTETVYVLEEGETEAEDSLGALHAPSIPEGGDLQSEYATGNHYRFYVANPDAKQIPGQEAPPVFDKYDDYDEVITIQEIDPQKKAPTGSYLTIAMTVDSKNQEFEKGEWVETNIRSLYLSKENLQLLQSQNIDIDTQRPIFEYTEEHDSTKHGYFIFDIKTGQMVTISSGGEVEIFDRSHDNHEMGKVLLLLNQDQDELDTASEDLPEELQKTLDSADIGKIGQIHLRDKVSDKLTLQAVTTLLHKEAEKTLGITITAPQYSADSSLGQFSQKLIDRAKGHTDLRLSSAYKKVIVAAFLKDNQKTMEFIEKRKGTIRAQLKLLERDQAGNTANGAQVEIDQDALTIKAGEGFKITNLSRETQPQIDLSANANNPIKNLTHFYKPDGSFNIVITRQDDSTNTYTVESAGVEDTVLTPETADKTQEEINKFFKSYGIDSAITETTSSTTPVGSKDFTLRLKFDNITTQLGLTIDGNNTISIYQLPKPLNQEATPMTRSSDLLKFPAVKAVLIQSNPTRKEAEADQASVNPDKLPVKLESMVKPGVDRMKSTLTLSTPNGARLTAEDLTPTVYDMICKALPLGTNSATIDRRSNPELTKAIGAMFAANPKLATAPQVGLGPKTKENFIRAFLRDHGSQLLGIGQDTPPAQPIAPPAMPKPVEPHVETSQELPAAAIAKMPDKAALTAQLQKPANPKNQGEIARATSTNYKLLFKIASEALGIQSSACCTNAMPKLGEVTRKYTTLLQNNKDIPDNYKQEILGAYIDDTKEQTALLLKPQETAKKFDAPIDKIQALLPQNVKIRGDSMKLRGESDHDSANPPNQIQFIYSRLPIEIDGKPTTIELHIHFSSEDKYGTPKIKIVSTNPYIKDSALKSNAEWTQQDLQTTMESFTAQETKQLKIAEAQTQLKTTKIPELQQKLNNHFSTEAFSIKNASNQYSTPSITIPDGYQIDGYIGKSLSFDGRETITTDIKAIDTNADGSITITTTEVDPEDPKTGKPARKITIRKNPA